MNSKETKIQIEVKIGEEYFTLTVPFSQQDEVRRTESELKIYLKELKAGHPNMAPSSYLAIAAYHFASNYFLLRGQYEKESDEAEELLREMSRFTGDVSDSDEDIPSGEFDEF